MSRSQRSLRVALLGLGTVGREVARGLLERGNELTERATGRVLALAVVGVRDPGRRRGVELPRAVRVTDDLRSVAQGEDVDVVVELLGGIHPARELVDGALSRGKAVVSANKALLARYGSELEARSRECAAPLRFEAAVGGGTPVLAPLVGDLAAARISAVSGIVNGTTNYILGQMAGRAMPYEDALHEAQALGYAEADPRADVEGEDAADKITLLARLAFGTWLERDAVPRAVPTVWGSARPGILGARSEELDAAAALDGALKLVASARRRADGEVDAAVMLTFVPESSALARTDGGRNRIEIESDLLGTVGFDGPGAGGIPTSSAVLADLLALARGEGSTWDGLAPPRSATGARHGRVDEPSSRFAFLPGVSADAIPQTVAASALEGPQGTAVVTRPLMLDELRASLGPLLTESADPCLYPLLGTA